jgi:RNA polymerase sigma factor (sigma-70 family)
MHNASRDMNHSSEQAEGGERPDSPVLGAPDKCPDPAAAAELRDLLEKLSAVVAALPSDARAILHTLYWEDRTQAQVAEEDGDSQPTVSRRVVEILAELKEAIEHAPPPSQGKQPRRRKFKKFGPNRE